VSRIKENEDIPLFCEDLIREIFVEENIESDDLEILHWTFRHDLV